MAAFAIAVAALIALPAPAAKAWGEATVTVGSADVAFPGGHLMPFFVCDDGWRHEADIWWSGNYDADPYPPAGRVTISSPPRSFTRLVTAPARMLDGTSSAGYRLQLNLTCRDEYGNESTGFAVIVMVASSGCPESIYWARPARPLRITTTAPASGRRTGAIPVTVTARNTSRTTWRGTIGFTVTAATDGWSSMPSLASVKYGRTVVRPRCLQAAPGGRIPLYLVSTVIGAGKAVTVRFSVVPGRGIRWPRVQWLGMRGIVQANGVSGWVAFTALK